MVVTEQAKAETQSEKKRVRYQLKKKYEHNVAMYIVLSKDL